MPVPLTWLAHSPGNFSFLRGRRSEGAQAALGAGEEAAKPDAAGVAPHLVAGDADGEQRRRLQTLRRILAGGLPNVPGVIVVGDATRGHGQIEYAGAQFIAGQGQVACVTGQQAALPVSDALPGGGFVFLFRREQNGQLGVAPVDQVVVR